MPTLSGVKPKLGPRSPIATATSMPNSSMVKLWTAVFPLLLVRPEFTTIPVAIFRLLAQPGESNLGQALAMSTLLMAVVALGFVAIERFRYRDVGGF